MSKPKLIGIIDKKINQADQESKALEKTYYKDGASG